jgi:hypothetical protein
MDVDEDEDSLVGMTFQTDKEVGGFISCQSSVLFVLFPVFLFWEYFS